MSVFGDSMQLRDIIKVKCRVRRPHGENGRYC